MSKKVWKNPWDGKASPDELRFKKITEPSLTVPGDAMTIKEIMARALGGTKPERTDAQYFDVENMDQINRFFQPALDLSDIDLLDKRATELMGQIEEAKKRKAEGEKNDSNDESEPEPEPKVDPEKDPEIEEGGSG